MAMPSDDLWGFSDEAVRVGQVLCRPEALVVSVPGGIVVTEQDTIHGSVLFHSLREA